MAGYPCRGAVSFLGISRVPFYDETPDTILQCRMKIILPGQLWLSLGPGLHPGYRLARQL